MNDKTKYSEQPLIQIIGLDDSYRGNDLEEFLIKNNLDFISKLGIKVSAEDFENEKFHNFKISNQLLRRGLTIGELGCTLAHKSAAQRLVDSTYNYSIIFEDDVRLIEVLDLGIISKFFKCDSAKILFLAWDPRYTIINLTQLESKDYFFKTVVPPTTTRAYVLNRSAAKIISQTPNMLNIVADWSITTINQIEFFTLHKPIAEESDLGSEIDLISKREAEIINNLIFRRLKTVMMILSAFFNHDLKKTGVTLLQVLNYILFRDLIFYVSKPNKLGKPFWILPSRFKFLKYFFKIKK